MVFTRRRRTTFRRRRPAFRRRRPMMRRRKLGLRKTVKIGMHFFKRNTSCNTMTLFTRASSVGSSNISNGYWLPQTNAAPALPAYYSFAMGFCLNDVPSATEFTLLFDQYMIKGVALKITPVHTSSDYPTSSYSNGGMLHLISDYDDMDVPATAETAIDDMRQRIGYTTTNIATGRPIRKYIRPHIALATYASGAFTSYANAKSQWLDCNSPNVQHYGIKGILEIWQNHSSAVTLPFKVEATYYLAFRNPR